MSLDIAYDSSIQVPNLAGKLAGSFSAIDQSHSVWLAHFNVPGNLTVGVNKSWELPILVDVARQAELIAIFARVRTAPTTTNIIVDINKNGTTIFTSQANRPTIPTTQQISNLAVPDISSLVNFDILSLDIDQVGTGTVGADLSVVLKFQQRTVF